MFKPLDALLHSELRLGIMSILMHIEVADFGYIKENTQSTAGNLSIQLQKLSDAAYITIEKSFKGKYPLTTCKITPKGKLAFEAYVEALRSYLRPDSP